MSSTSSSNSNIMILSEAQATWDIGRILGIKGREDDSEVISRFSELENKNGTVVLAKLLSGRLKKVLPSVIGEIQFDFLSGRNILDEVLIANEVVDGWKKNGKKGILLKLDFEKEYDHVN
ncbi:hypothetical protein F0562_012013 [Nyssa sinensis]|uniref:Uncharacterized protein n=1 Tax=Nyssa sinensis TaxID=561372 RepID=A0A5J4ZSD2_9ASTE|nr:hypothetical protein F0562_012013 [Nyssa sinensis]